MKRSSQTLGRMAATTFTTAVCIALLAGSARGAQPLVPLPTPYYSFDLASPTVNVTGTVGAADVLKVVHPASGDSRAEVLIPAAALHLDKPGDELDALSSPNPGVPEAATFTLLLSVDRATQGGAQADPTLVLLGVPYNVRNQALRGHAAADLFMSTQLFTRNGIVPSAERMLGGNTVLIINNYDEGGTDFAGEPESSASGSSGDPEDEVDAVINTSGIDTNGVRGAPSLPVLYYSASADSPSLKIGQLPGSSGADVFGIITKPGTTPFPYASFAQLGLQPADDIDGVLVFDSGQNVFSFGPGDQVLLSLTADSPTLQMVPGASAADIISVTRTTGGTQLTFFAQANDLGLQGANSPDNIDAIEFLFCSDAEECARRHGIRRVGDVNRDTKVDLFDASFFWSCHSGPWQSPTYVVPTAACQGSFDTDEDTDVDVDDWKLFAHDMTGPL